MKIKTVLVLFWKSLCWKFSQSSRFIDLKTCERNKKRKGQIFKNTCIQVDARPEDETRWTFFDPTQKASQIFVFSCLGWHDLQSLMVFTLTLASKWLSNCCLKYQRIQLPVILQPPVYIYPMQWFKRGRILKHASTSLYEQDTASITQHFGRHHLCLLSFLHRWPMNSHSTVDDDWQGSYL